MEPLPPPPQADIPKASANKRNEAIPKPFRRRARLPPSNMARGAANSNAIEGTMPPNRWRLSEVVVTLTVARVWVPPFNERGAGTEQTAAVGTPEQKKVITPEKPVLPSITKV